MRFDHSEQLKFHFGKVARLVFIGISPMVAVLGILLIMLVLSHECMLMSFGAKRVFVNGQICQGIRNIFLPEKEPLPTPSLPEGEI